jgi:alpha-1,2-mannosyltransferase
MGTAVDVRSWKPVAWARGLSTGTLTVIALLLWLGVGLYMLHFGRQWDLDLRVYRGAGQSLLRGDKPYRSLFTGRHLAFTYPPFALTALLPLAFGPLWVVKTIWWLLSAVCLVSVLALGLRHTTTLRGGRLVAGAGILGALSVMILEPLRSNMDYGQINWILMLLVVVDLTTVRGRWRGTLVGVAAAIKLTPLVFLGYFLAQRQWRPLARGVSVFIGLTLVGCIALQMVSFHFWLNLVSNNNGHIGPTGFVSNQSWLGLLSRTPFQGGTWAHVVWVPLVLVTLGAGLLLTRCLVTSHREIEAVVALAFTELLVSPISWTHHWSWVALLPLIVAREWRRNRLVAGLMALLVILAAAAPYWWVRPAWIANNSLVLAGAALLFVWTWSEWRSTPTPPRHEYDDDATVAVDDPGRRPPAVRPGVAH